jgi:hypothetical protein
MVATLPPPPYRQVREPDSQSRRSQKARLERFENRRRFFVISTCNQPLKGTKMGTMTTILYILLLAAVIVAVDFLFFKQHFWARLTVNIGIVLVFVAFYLRFLAKSTK